MICNYCNQPAALVKSSAVYGPNSPSYGYMWLCRPCSAYVGCHRGTTTALGSLANYADREWRKKAHAAFDPIWLEMMHVKRLRKHTARHAAYTWLAEQLGIDREACHMAYFNADECKRVIAVCTLKGRMIAAR